VENCHRTLGWKKAEEFPKHFLLSDELFKLANIILDNLGKRDLKLPGIPLYQIILLYIYYKASNSFLATTVLCDRGLVGDAKTCCRKLIEMLINMKYLMDDKDKRQYQYFYHLPVAMDKDFRKVTESPDLHSESVTDTIRAMMTDVEDWLDKAKKYWDTDENGKITGDFRRNWSGKNLAEMAKDCGMKYAYVNPYLLYCRSIHASVDDMSNYFSFPDTAFGQHFEHDDIPSVMIEAIRAYWALSALVTEAFDMKLAGSLTQIMDRFRALERELGKA